MPSCNDCTNQRWYAKAFCRLDANGAAIKLSNEYLHAIVCLLAEAIEIDPAITLIEPLADALVLLDQLDKRWNECAVAAKGLD